MTNDAQAERNVYIIAGPHMIDPISGVRDRTDPLTSAIIKENGLTKLLALRVGLSWGIVEQYRNTALYMDGLINESTTEANEIIQRYRNKKMVNGRGEEIYLGARALGIEAKDELLGGNPVRYEFYTMLSMAVDLADQGIPIELKVTEDTRNELDYLGAFNRFDTDKANLLMGLFAMAENYGLSPEQVAQKQTLMMEFWELVDSIRERDICGKVRATRDKENLVVVSNRFDLRSLGQDSRLNVYRLDVTYDKEHNQFDIVGTIPVGGLEGLLTYCQGGNLALNVQVQEVASGMRGN